MLLPMCATAAAFYPDKKICILGRQLKIWFQPNSMQNKREIKSPGLFLVKIFMFLNKRLDLVEN
jgi:hypothetical protein